MKDAIVACVAKRRFATFQDLTDEVPGFFGDRGMFNPGWPGIVTWHAVSQEAIVAIGELIGSKRIFMHLAPAISYRADKDFPPFARCRSLEEDGQGPEIKWLPVVFTVTPKL
jgi:hypothetical protein